MWVSSAVRRGVHRLSNTSGQLTARRLDRLTCSLQPAATVGCSRVVSHNKATLASASSNQNQRILLRQSTTTQRSQVRHMADLPTHIKVALPALSPTMEMGTIVNWEKKVGDQVSEGDLLCEIETDKATMGFETPEEGYLAKIMLEAGSKDIPVGKLLCIIVENAEDVAKFADFVDDGKSASSAQPAAAPAPKEAAAPPPPPSPAAVPAPPPPSLMAQSTSGDRPFASPAAKRLAAERGLDLFQIKSGSGMDGMITSRDVENFKGAPAAAPAAGFPAAMPLGGGFPTGDHMVYTDADTTNMRKIIAKRLQQSKHEIPHYYLTVECNMDDILKFRSEINKTYEKEGVKLSVNDFIIKATALASKRVPQCNSAWMDSYIREYHTCDVSIAVDTGNGLITPIVTNVESRGLADISETVKELAGRAKEGKLQPHEFQGGSITVSNLGMFGINQFTAIINPPQACILAVGGTEKKVVVGKGGEPVVSSMMRVTMSCDHRVVDGAVGAQWLAHFKKFMENPQAMLL